MKTLLEWTDEKNIDLEAWSEPESFTIVEGNEPGKVNLVFDGCRVMLGDDDTPTPDSDRELEDALREREWAEAMRQWRNMMARLGEHESPEKPMDCAECGNKAEVTLYSAFAVTSDERWQCACVNKDCPEPVLRGGTRQELWWLEPETELETGTAGKVWRQFTNKGPDDPCNRLRERC